MKVAQITWISYPNFGTFLQAFALQRSLAKLGIESYILDDRRFTNQSSRLRSFVAKIYFSIYYKKFFFFDQIKLEARYKKFCDKFLKIDRKWRSFADLNNQYSTFICGSDQIWSPLLPDHHEGFYFAAFADKSADRIAYAPSLGSKTCNEEYVRIIQPWLESFNYLSAREEEGAEILKDITGRKDIPVVLDPTLLLSHKEWVDFEKEYHKNPIKTDTPYLLAYFLTFNEKYLERTKEIAKAKGLKLVVINNLPGFSKYADELINCGPIEFLSAIAECSYLVTDSFHGSIFALQLHKPFLTFKRFKDDSHNSQNSRIENLFRLCEITDNFLDETDSTKLPKEPDWAKIDELISAERVKSIDYLKTALNL